MYSSLPTMRTAWLKGCKRSRSVLNTSSLSNKSTNLSIIPSSTILPTIHYSRSFFSTSPEKEKIGPEFPTEKGLAAEQGQLPRRWIDEPVPASSLSAVEEFPG